MNHEIAYRRPRNGEEQEQALKAFVHNSLPGRVVFGSGALEHLSREIELLGAKRALVLSTPEQKAQAEDIARRLRTAVSHEGSLDDLVMEILRHYGNSDMESRSLISFTNIYWPA